MFNPLKKHKQALSETECRAVLARHTSGVLALLGDNGYTYGVPLNYCLEGDALYFHGLRAGAKIDAIRHHDRVSFTVIAQATVVPADFTTHFVSVIAFGRVRLIEDPDEAKAAVFALTRHCCPGPGEAAIEENWTRFGRGVAAIALDIEHLSGKRAVELLPKE